MIIVGIDPDSVKHGFAEYRDNELVALRSMSLMDIIDWIDDTKHEDRLFSIEDVSANNFVYARNQSSKKNSIRHSEKSWPLSAGAGGADANAR